MEGVIKKTTKKWVKNGREGNQIRKLKSQRNFSKQSLFKKAKDLKTKDYGRLKTEIDQKDEDFKKKYLVTRQIFSRNKKS